MKNNQVKLKDIGRKLNLSAMAISKALKDAPDISKATKELVKKTALEMGYIPDFWAKNSRKGNLNNIAYIYHASIVENHPLAHFSHEFISGARKIISGPNQYISLFQLSTHPFELTVEKLPIALKERLSDGVIIEFDVNPQVRTYLEQLCLPVVYLNCNVQEKYNCIWRDEKYATRQAVKHFVERGYERIIYPDFRESDMKNEHSHFSALHRIEGYREEMKTQGLKSEIVRGRNNIIKSVSKIKKPFAFIGGAGLYVILLEEGLRAPQDVAIIDIDMDFAASRTFRKLDRIPLDRYMLGMKAAEMLMKKIKTGKNIKSYVAMPDAIENGSSMKLK